VEITVQETRGTTTNHASLSKPDSPFIEGNTINYRINARVNGSMLPGQNCV